MEIITEQIIDIGDVVLCDDCNEEYTESEAQGGILFGSRAICPSCTPKWEENAVKFDEEEYITDRALPGETFHSFIMRIRGGDNTIKIQSFAT